MKIEEQLMQQTTQELPREPSLESVSTRFPIVDTGETYYGDDGPQLQEDSILFYFKETPQGEKLPRFRLLKVIEDLHYVFTFGGTSGDSYWFSFATEEFEYATTNLSKEGQDALIATIVASLESITAQENMKINEIYVSPAHASYSSQEIEECRGMILTSPKNTFTKEELIRSYKGSKIFELYRELFDKDFHEIHSNKRSRAEGRGRYFKSIVQKHLPNWQVGNAYARSEFILKPKETQNEKQSE